MLYHKYIKPESLTNLPHKPQRSPKSLSTKTPCLQDSKHCTVNPRPPQLNRMQITPNFVRTPTHKTQSAVHSSTGSSTCLMSTITLADIHQEQDSSSPNVLHPHNESTYDDMCNTMHCLQTENVNSPHHSHTRLCGCNDCFFENAGTPHMLIKPLSLQLSKILYRCSCIGSV